MTGLNQAVEYRNPTAVHGPKRGYSHVAVVTDPAASLCFVSGQVGVDANGVVHPTLDAQIEQVFVNLASVLADVGSSLHNVVQLTTYLVDQADIDPFVARRAELFPYLFPDGYPPNTLVVVGGLARPSLRIEVQAIAAIPRRAPPAALDATGRSGTGANLDRRRGA